MAVTTFFTSRIARRAVERYRKNGVDNKTPKRMLAFLEEHGIEGATVVETGGGVGELQIELLKRGAARTMNLELSPGYDEEAGIRASRLAQVEVGLATLLGLAEGQRDGLVEA